MGWVTTRGHVELMRRHYAQSLKVLGLSFNSLWMFLTHHRRACLPRLQLVTPNKYNDEMPFYWPCIKSLVSYADYQKNVWPSLPHLVGTWIKYLLTEACRALLKEKMQWVA